MTPNTRPGGESASGRVSLGDVALYILALGDGDEWIWVDFGSSWVNLGYVALYMVALGDGLAEKSATRGPKQVK